MSALRPGGIVEMRPEKSVARVTRVLAFDLRVKFLKIVQSIGFQTVLFPFSHQSNSSPRVVITGAGIVTALGQGWKPNAEGFRSGRAAFRPITLFDVSRQRVKMGAEVDGSLT